MSFISFSYILFSILVLSPIHDIICLVGSVILIVLLMCHVYGRLRVFLCTSGVFLPFSPVNLHGTPPLWRGFRYTIIPRHSRGYFIFGHSPHTTGRPHVGIGCLPARIGYLPPVNGSCGSNRLSWSASLSAFSWLWIYAFIAAVFLPVVST